MRSIFSDQFWQKDPEILHSNSFGLSVPNPKYGLVICGGGPAGIGPILAAARTGQLKELLDLGVLLVEPARIGPGALRRHQIVANSLGGAFLECLDVLDELGFRGVRNSRPTLELVRHADEYPPLSVVADFLELVGDYVWRLLRDHPSCAVLTGAEVQRIELHENLGLDLTICRLSDRTTKVVRADRAALVMGGMPLHVEGAVEVAPGLMVDRSDPRVCHAHEMIAGARPLPESGRVVVLGGSHSAWSVVRQLTRGSSQPDREVTVLHRTPIRLYYPSAQAAHADGYPFDPDVDVCPLSGRVNRYGGLRGPARELARAALGHETGPAGRVRTLQVPVQVQVQGADSAAAARAALAAADVIVLATGYQAALPELVDAQGQPIRPAVDATGTVVSSRVRLVDANGTEYPQLLGYGLGAGLPASTVAGGEASYHRRADGVWLYQNDIGDLVVDELLHPATAAPLASCASVSASTPRQATHA
ncbi:hypothetical protein ABH931_007017 [Streptacidiphilus sp. MAP12-33]|uniref:FrbG n=1 Tax=Streptacidiphilus sp. MAP12-33 TaxID=3156266 RepID=UPI00351436D2